MDHIFVAYHDGEEKFAAPTIGLAKLHIMRTEERIKTWHKMDDNWYGLDEHLGIVWSVLKVPFYTTLPS